MSLLREKKHFILKTGHCVEENVHIQIASTTISIHISRNINTFLVLCVRILPSVDHLGADSYDFTISSELLSNNVIVIQLLYVNFSVIRSKQKFTENDALGPVCIICIHS